MKVIHARNVHCALPEACYQLLSFGVDRGSRNGPVKVFPSPLTTVYERPRERVLFWKQRDANPFFHLFESLWMLAGRQDVEWLQRFNSRIAQYSDDGVRFNAAYGHRWRAYFGKDQLKEIGANLRANPECRRQVLQVWDAGDLSSQSKDVPCNTQVFFQRDSVGNLDMMVTNRSNDLVWGAYGANAVHYSILQEYVAGIIGCHVGRYWQTSMNTHLYLDQHAELLTEMACKAADPVKGPIVCPYEREVVKPFPLMSIPAGRWDRELSAFMSNPDGGFSELFFSNVAVPMHNAWSAYKAGGPDRFAAATRALHMCAASDWMLAGLEWIQRRQQAAEAA